MRNKLLDKLYDKHVLKDYLPTKFCGKEVYAYTLQELDRYLDYQYYGEYGIKLDVIVARSRQTLPPENIIGKFIIGNMPSGFFKVGQWQSICLVGGVLGTMDIYRRESYGAEWVLSRLSEHKFN